jgi:transketolase
MGALCGALFDARNQRGHGRPIAIVAKTFKGHAFPGIENELDWHGKALGDKADAVIASLEGQLKNKTGPVKIPVAPPTKDAVDVKLDLKSIKLSQPPQYKLGEQVATRLAYGTALVKLGQACDRVIALDGDVSNSTYSEKFRKAFPDRYIECFIAEQNMVGVAIGCSTRGRTIPFCSTFATFYTRAGDQLRMGAISMANIKCCGSHVGVSIGEDGPSQMGLEDIALFRTLPGSTVFYPSDAVSCERAVELAARTPGICFIRTSRPNTPVVYENDAPFEVGKGHMIRRSNEDRVLLIGAGVTLVEALKAADVLDKEGIHAAVFDPFTVKPLDVAMVNEEAKRVGGNVVVIEDHYPEGGLGEAVLSALTHGSGFKGFKHLAVRNLPRSGPPDALIDRFGLSANHIVKAAKELIG